MHARHARSAYRYDTSPGPSDSPITVAGVKYHQSDNNLTLSRIVRHTPKPTGHHRFSSIEVVHSGGPVVEKLRAATRVDSTCPVRWYELPPTHRDPEAEFRAIFEVEERMMLARANRQTLIVWVGRADQPELDGFAGFFGMLPFRGIAVALVSADTSAYPDPYWYRTPSGLLEHDSTDPARMGKVCVHAMFGPLPTRTFAGAVREWRPIDVQPEGGSPMLRLPFKIAGLAVPMITFIEEYER